MVNIVVSCPYCRHEFIRRRKDVNLTKKRSGVWSCRSCATKRLIDGNKAPIGYRKKHPSGYIDIKSPGGWMREHRYVMEQIIGRALAKDEEVHHINGIKDDNRPENLQLVTRAEHQALHHQGRIRSEKTRKLLAEKSRQRKGGLNQDDIPKIRSMVSGGVAQRKVAMLFNVSPMTISRVINNQTWRSYE